jgi:hypothetical protein
MSSTTDQPTAVRRLDNPTATTLADLASIFDDLQTVLRCCERLVTELAADEPDDLFIEALWTTAVLSYSRCFAHGRTGTALTEQDLTQSQLRGEVQQWHKVLRQMRHHYADPSDNPRERFSVGAAQDSDGSAHGIAITSTRQPRLDDVTVRQTGALAYELSQLVDERITQHQQRVREATKVMSKAELDKLPLIDLGDTSEPDAGSTGTSGGDPSW